MAKKIDYLGFDEMNRPCFDLYFMNLAFEVACRSFDPSTKCGCIIVNESGGVLSTGYNNPPRNAVDSKIPLTRPRKYIFFEHAERNAIYNAARNGTPLLNSVFFITGLPCYDCLRGILSVGAVRVVYGPLGSVMQSQPDYLQEYKLLLENQLIKIESFKYNDGLFKINPKIQEIVKDRMSLNIDEILK